MDQNASDISTLTGRVDSLGNALHFRGAGTTAQRDALENPANGDVFIIIDAADENDGKEYVYNNNAWVEFGDVSDYATKASLAAEQERAEAAEDALDKKIIAEKERAEAAEKANADAIVAEAERATDAEKALQDGIDGLDSRVGDIEDILGETGSLAETLGKLEQDLKDYADQAEADAITAAKDYTDDEIDKVEETISGLADEVATKASAQSVTDLTARVKTNEDNIGALQILTSEQGEVIADHTESIANIEGDISDINENIGDMNALGASDLVTGITANATSIESLIDALSWHPIV